MLIIIATNKNLLTHSRAANKDSKGSGCIGVSLRALSNTSEGIVPLLREGRLKDGVMR